MPKKRKPTRRDIAAQELWNPKYRMRVCRDRTKYCRKDKNPRGRFDSGHCFLWALAIKKKDACKYFD